MRAESSALRWRSSESDWSEVVGVSGFGPCYRLAIQQARAGQHTVRVVYKRSVDIQLHLGLVPVWWEMCPSVGRGTYRSAMALFVGIVVEIGCEQTKKHRP